MSWRPAVFRDEAVLPHPARRNSGIDLLRGLAIMLVVLNHIGLRIPLKDTWLEAFLPRHVLVALNYNGYEAVLVFFVISGFLITGNALRRWGALSRIDVRSFYGLRFSRIVPCLLLLVVVLGVLHGLGFDDYRIKHEGQSLAGATFAALALHLNWYEGRTGYLPGNWDVLWSLSIEEVFYLGFPLLCLLARRPWVLVPLLLGLAVSMPWTHAALAGNEIWQEKAYLPGMAAIAIGVLCALLAARWRKAPAWAGRSLGAVGTLGLLAVLFAGSMVWHLLGDGYLLLLTLSTSCLLLALDRHPPGDAGRAIPGLAWLCSWGRLSYEIYLSHMFVVYAVVRLYRWSGGDIAWGAWWYVLALPACWLLGALVARFVSVPCERWLRARLPRATAVAPATVAVANPVAASRDHG